MFVPNYVHTKVIQEEGDRKGYFESPWEQFFSQLRQNMQQALSNEGFVIPPVSSAMNSVMPPATNGQLGQLQASFGKSGGTLLGTLIFDPAEINGGSSDKPNGQLKIILADGTFHKITNT